MKHPEHSSLFISQGPGPGQHFGHGSPEPYFDICHINDIVYQHKYSPSDLEPQ